MSQDEKIVTFFDNSNKMIKLEELKKKDRVNKELLAIKYVIPMGMVGTFYSIDLLFTNNTICFSNQESIGGPLICKTYSLSLDDINKVKEELDKYNLPKWNTIPINKSGLKTNQIINAIHIVYDFEIYAIPSNALMDEEEREIYNSFINLLKSFMKEENFIKEDILNNPVNN